MSVGKIEFLARALCVLDDNDPDEVYISSEATQPTWVFYEKRAELLAKLLAKSDKVWNERSKRRVSKQAKKGD